MLRFEFQSHIKVIYIIGCKKYYTILQWKTT